MSIDLSQFERHARQRLEEFLDPRLKRQRPNTRTARPTQGITVILAVRRSGSLLDHHFTHHSPSISRLQARLEAERAAREAGYPIVGYVVEYR